MKGKLFTSFKNFSKFDLVFYTFVIFIIALLYLFFKRDTVVIPIKVKITDDNPLYAVNYPRTEYAQAFKVGDTEKDGIGRVISKITRVDSFKLIKDQVVTYVTIDVKAIYDPRKKQYMAKGKSIVFGESLFFNFSLVRFKGLVVETPYLKNEYKKNITTVEAQLRVESRFYADTYGVPPYIAEALHENDAVLDSNGQVLARIKNIVIHPAKRLLTTQNGQIIQTDDPELHDVYMTVELATKTVNNQEYMFDHLPVIVGQQIPLNFATVEVSPTITRVTVH